MKKQKTKLFTNGTPDYILLALIGLIFLIGIVTLLSASAPSALSATGNSHIYFKRQLIFAVVGIILGLIISIIDYRVWNNKNILLMIFLGIIVAAISVKLIGNEAKGAVRWIQIGQFSLQPSEFIKIGMVVLVSGYLSQLEKRKLLKSPLYSVVIPIITTLFVAGLIFKLQNHLSAAIIITIATFTQMLIAGVNKKAYISFIVLGMAIAITFVMTKFSNSAGGFRQERIKVWMDPFKYIKTTGWQISQSLYALAGGGLLGVGIGNSRQKQNYIPEPQNDFIFAIFSEEMGFFGVIVMMLIFFALIARAFQIAAKAPDLFGKLLATGITSILATQIVLNLAVVSNTIPVTGISLPLFSYGGSAIIATFMGLGFLISVSRVVNQKIKN